jgi:hypothetical protein
VRTRDGLARVQVFEPIAGFVSLKLLERRCEARDARGMRRAGCVVQGLSDGVWWSERRCERDAREM